MQESKAALLRTESRAVNGECTFIQVARTHRYLTRLQDTIRIADTGRLLLSKSRIKKKTEKQEGWVGGRVERVMDVGITREWLYLSVVN